MSNKNSEPQFLIVSLAPQNLERGDLWFQENHEQIKRARATNLWWRENALTLEKDLVIKPGVLIRHLTHFGYERASHVLGKGIFAVRGGIIEIWPVNESHPFIIEFSGNTIAEIQASEPHHAITHTPKSHRIQKIAELPEHSFVVHEDHGIGIFRGMSQTVAGTFFIIEYAHPAPSRDPDRLFVPENQEKRLTPYIGFETPRVHRLGGTIWIKTKRKVREETEKLARELLQLYAKRHHAERSPYPEQTEWEDKLREEFPHEETPDQTRIEQEILHDLVRTTPMDRILCGDVGFGKTELAIRAAMRVMGAGAQVAVLAPTTILAAQHEKTFQDRFKTLPIKIAMLSRLTPPREERQILQGIAEGIIDCIIGTHRILGKDVVFKNLGFVILDEEQRFGVSHKEHFKKLRAEIDILSLSATPIPRTLQFTLARLRDISLLETPPPERLPIATFVLPRTARMIRDAICIELLRGGQVYFLHNRVETIGMAHARLLKILNKNSRSDGRLHSSHRKPLSFKIGIMHGRMKERELITTMARFREGTINILLATTIIENGLDISSANTLIVEDATRLGLTQAHQLRGRIGRSGTQAFAYFFYRPRSLTEKAAGRLAALQEYSQLGDGYQLAIRDLELRGAGNILGREQSGAVNKVGLNLYYQMLGDAIEEMSEEQKKSDA
ncbi:MAG: transcription-repair coupling factor [Parcubacteria group bacterium Gr01-1014_66]|nr:MAG: transcription-repair coupling factor [Parcubacteria group bacterium Gr01-1014_66]